MDSQRYGSPLFSNHKPLQHKCLQKCRQIRRENPSQLSWSGLPFAQESNVQPGCSGGKSGGRTGEEPKWIALSGSENFSGFADNPNLPGRYWHLNM